MSDKKTDFGYKKVEWNEKKDLVKNVFDSVATRYDIMNDFMSMGIHRWWKRKTIDTAGVMTGSRVLDLAGGTGDLTKAFADRVGQSGLVILADINAEMLKVGRARLQDRGIAGNVAYVQANAEKLSFPENYFDCITIAFGLRNVTDKQAALNSMFRVLKPGGKLFILEFSHPPSTFLKKIYDAYSFSILPKIGQLVTGDKESYQYLVESIRMHPNQEKLADMMRLSGFQQVGYENFTGGIVALHQGQK